MNEEELRQSLATLEVYKAQLESLVQQQQIIQYSIEEYARAMKTLESYSRTEEGGEMLVPVGGNSYVFARVCSNSRSLVGVGSGVAVEKPIPEALETLERRIKELSESDQRLNERIEKIEAESSKLSRKLQEAYQRMQKEE